MGRVFDHERLAAYRAALAFWDGLEPVLQRLPKSLWAVDQLERAGTSIRLFKLPSVRGQPQIGIRITIASTSRIAVRAEQAGHSERATLYPTRKGGPILDPDAEETDSSSRP
jgi:hypothetical protein